MKNLALITQRFCDENGIKYGKYASYVGISPKKCSLWFSGLTNLSPDEEERTLSFLAGKCFKQFDDIVQLVGGSA